MKVEVADLGSFVPGSPYGLWGRKATLNYTELNLIVVARGYRQATGSPAVVEGEESETLSAFVVTDSLLINSSVGDRLVMESPLACGVGRVTKQERHAEISAAEIEDTAEVEDTAFNDPRTNRYFSHPHPSPTFLLSLPLIPLLPFPPGFILCAKLQRVMVDGRETADCHVVFYSVRASG